MKKWEIWSEHKPDGASPGVYPTFVRSAGSRKFLKPAQVGVALPKNSPGPPFSRRPEHPPTGTLWAPDMHSSRSALHACSFAWTGGWEARKVENGTHEKQIRQTTCCTCSIYIRRVLKAETLIDHSCGRPVGLIALLHLRIPTLKIQGSAKPWGQASAPPPTGVSHVTEKGTETERTQTPFSFSAKCNE